MSMVALQPEICPELPVVIGNIDYTRYKETLARIDQLLRGSGAEKSFIKCYLDQAEQRHREQADHTGAGNRSLSHKDILRLEQHAILGLRCNIIRSLENLPCRELSRRLADSPLLQWFCQLGRMGRIKVPSKSTLDRYARVVSEEVVRDIVKELIRTAAGQTASADPLLGLEKPISLDNLFLDTTCVKANIHFPVDWVLLRDISRTLLKAVTLIRRRGLKNRMADPAEFSKATNRLCIRMTNVRRQKESKKKRKLILRLMKKLTRQISRHGKRHRDLLVQNWEETDFGEGEVNQILGRIDGVLAQLPAAIEQAHERIIGERPVANKDKILSLYEQDIHVSVRGKAGAEVEFGNTFLLGEQSDGVIVDWLMIKDQAPSDSKLIKASLERCRELRDDTMPIAVIADRGFDSFANRKLLAKYPETFNAICPKSPVAMKEQMRDPRFAELQKRRSQTEARIGIFTNSFLGRPMRRKGFVNRELNITWSVLAHNLWVIARLPTVNTSQMLLSQAA